jgi:hypothetical protein
MFLRNAAVPICRLCKYIKMDLKHPTDYTFARCSKFGEQCVISGEVKFTYAQRCRSNFTLCGEDGKYYEKKQE